MYIYDGIRTPFGRHAGALATIRPDDLVAQVITRLMQRNRVVGDVIEDVVIGCSNQAGEDSRNVGRHAALLAGLPCTVPGITVNRLCGSGLAAVLDAARMATVGGGDLFIAGGVESMSRGPFAVAKAEKPFSRAFTAYDTSMGERFPNPRITAEYGNDTMPQTADNVAKEFGITREQADAYAARSQVRYAAAERDGVFETEMMTVEVPAGRAGEVRTVDADEAPRPGTTLEKLGGLRPLFEGGVVTAGNASGINDGAAAMFVGSEIAESQYGLKPRARIVSSAVAGLEPRIMGLGPVYAAQKALDRAGVQLDDMDVIELNEAFASQVLGCLRMLSLDAEDHRLNPNGGAIAIGHPLGASGARLTLTAVNELERRQGRYALITLCIGVGQGIATVIERV